MTSAQIGNLRINKSRYLADIAELDRVVREISLNGTATASLSAGGGTKAYTAIDLNTLLALRRDYAARVGAINRALRHAAPGGIRHIEIVRC